MKRVLRSLFIFGTLAFLTFRIKGQYDHVSAHDRQINIVLGVIAFFILMGVLLADQRQYAVERKWTQFVPSVIGITLTLLLGVVMLKLYTRDKVPSILLGVGKMNTFVSRTLELKADHTYKVSSYDLSSDFYRGTYVMQDSLITLDRVVEDKDIVSKRMLIVTSHLNNTAGSIKRTIYQIDDDGNIIPDALRFKVIEHKK